MDVNGEKNIIFDNKKILNFIQKPLYSKNPLFSPASIHVVSDLV
jgi:hypothetical protein